MFAKLTPGSDREYFGVDRRKVLTSMAYTAGATSLSTMFSGPALAAIDVSTGQRAWAKRNMRGIVNLHFPSFLPDMHTLDEEGIRIQVRNSIAHGFFATMLTPQWSLTWDDPRWVRMVEIIMDEAKGKIRVQAVINGTNLEADIALIRRAEAMGFSLLAIHPRNSPSSSAQDVYSSFQRRITATQLPVTIYAAVKEGLVFPHLGPMGQPLDVFDRLADLPNVVGMKISQPVPLMTTVQICERIADRVLIAPVNLDFAPLLGTRYDIQWSGQWNAEAVQTPEQRLGIELLASIAARNPKRVSAAVRRIQPVLELFYELQAALVLQNAYPVQHNKYYAWLGGGNGGLMPIDQRGRADTVPVLDAHDRKRMRDAFVASGLTPTSSPDDEFIVGRAAWRRGVRPDPLTPLPKYSR